MFHKIIAHGVLGASVISSALGTKLPSPGTIYLSQDLKFLRSVVIADTGTATLTVTEKATNGKPGLVLDCRCTNESGEKVIAGTARVCAPTEKVRRPRVALPEVEI